MTDRILCTSFLKNQILCLACSIPCLMLMGRMWIPSGMRLGRDDQLGEFVEGLGPSQLVCRQVLGASSLGEIQLGLYDRKGHLEVEVIRARSLTSKPGARVLPGECRCNAACRMITCDQRFIILTTAVVFIYPNVVLQLMLKQ